MELLDRYLAAVRRNLPTDEASDITEELRDVLLARAEESQAASGDANWPVLLKEFGHPLVVAARYRKHQWLIGPELYPFYVHFMKVVGLIVVAVTVAVATVKAVFGAGDIGGLVGRQIAAHGGQIAVKQLHHRSPSDRRRMESEIEFHSASSWARTRSPSGDRR